MSRDAQQELVLAAAKFDYAPFPSEVAAQLRAAAQRIRRSVQQTLDVLIAVGKDLLAVKEAMPHGRFGPWVRAEFGWGERTARNFMAVALRFGGKTETIAEMGIEATAAYLLAAPSTPEAAAREALKRARGGERITGPVAREIIARLCPREKRGRTGPEQRPLAAVLDALETLRRRWGPRDLGTLARQLRDFADSLEEKGK
jgi:hypothetical protein